MTRYRIRFTKGGDLRFLSHHDLMRLMERMLRRADLPIAFTEGFHPKPRMQFPSALALGVVGWEEVAEIDLREPLEPKEVQCRLAAQALPGLEIRSVRQIPLKTTGQIVEASYRLALTPEQLAGVSERIARLLEAPEWIVERRRPQPRRIDIRPYLLDLHLNGSYLHLTLRVTPSGGARAEEVLTALGLEGVLLDGGILERTQVVLADEIETSSARDGSDPQPARPTIGGNPESFEPQKGSA
jgi:radical SAM-linked protein